MGLVVIFTTLRYLVLLLHSMGSNYLHVKCCGSERDERIWKSNRSLRVALCLPLASIQTSSCARVHNEELQTTDCSGLCPIKRRLGRQRQHVDQPAQDADRPTPSSYSHLLGACHTLHRLSRNYWITLDLEQTTFLYLYRNRSWLADFVGHPKTNVGGRKHNGLW